MKALKVEISGIGLHYDIKIKRDIKDELLSYIRSNFYGRRLAIITDSNLYRLYEATMIKSIRECNEKNIVISIEPGEKSKSIEDLMNIYGTLAEFSMTRGDLIVAFGGGVVGDLAGFAASTYLRGVPYIQLPTSLLAQVDSSVGGKTAIDLPYGKNLVGSFYHPQAVFIDPKLLETLDKKYLRDGLAEVIKYGCIKDSRLFEQLESYISLDEMLMDMEAIIYNCCAIKSSVVEKDERDTGERMLLNFGHTLGHAIEKYFDYEEYTHGEAVAIGMAEIASKGEALGITEQGSAKRIKAMLEKFGLPNTLPHMDKTKIIETMMLDKKFSGNTISLIVLEKIGTGKINKVASEELGKYF